MAQVFLVDNFTAVAFQGNPAAVCLLDKSNEVNDDRKRKFGGEFNVPTAFPRPLDSEDFLTAKRFKLDVFTHTTQLPISESATLATAHVLTSLNNPNEEFEFETLFGEVRARVEKHDFTTLFFPVVKVVSLDSHKQELTDKLQTIPDPDGVGLKIAALIPSDVVVSQLAYCPPLKTVLIALDQATTHEQFMSLSLPRDRLLAVDPEGKNVRAVILTFHFIPPPTPQNVQSVQQLLPYLSEPDYVVRAFEPWNGIDEDPGSGSAQIVAAPFWAQVYNRTNNLRGFQFHPKRAAEFRAELRENTVEISGQSIHVFNGYLSEKSLQ